MLLCSAPESKGRHGGESSDLRVDGNLVMHHTVLAFELQQWLHDASLVGG